MTILLNTKAFFKQKMRSPTGHIQVRSFPAFGYSNIEIRSNKVYSSFHRHLWQIELQSSLYEARSTGSRVLNIWVGWIRPIDPKTQFTRLWSFVEPVLRGFLATAGYCRPAQPSPRGRTSCIESFRQIRYSWLNEHSWTHNKHTIDTPKSHCNHIVVK